jgi:hypothetical protein
LTARPNGTASHIPDRSAICLCSRCLCGRTQATITNARRLNEDACIRSRKLEPAFFSGLVFGHTILEIPKRGSLTILVIHSRRRSAIICPLAVSGKRRLLKRSLSCRRPSSGSIFTPNKSISTAPPPKRHTANIWDTCMQPIGADKICRWRFGRNVKFPTAQKRQRAKSLRSWFTTRCADQGQFLFLGSFKRMTQGGETVPPSSVYPANPLTIHGATVPLVSLVV